jgi:hypothetical protein
LLQIEKKRSDIAKSKKEVLFSKLESKRGLLMQLP